ncbi:hypothetical protein CA601_00375 [Paraburkholderia hospita]|nr:hypothetical protein CA602_42320 [Paraburkholderia hospita]OUL97221.1 hypothetical protein CA601_00375 [Paraburkholderia hospita]
MRKGQGVDFPLFSVLRCDDEWKLCSGSAVHFRLRSARDAGASLSGVSLAFIHFLAHRRQPVAASAD